MKLLKTFAAAIAILISTATFADDQLETSELQVVDYVDIERYLGTWYEVASIPQWFQKNCESSRAEYRPLSGNRIQVINSCTQFDGSENVARGRARVVDTDTNAKLKVSFFWPFSGDYWIIDLGENYEYAVVGNPDRDSLWILSRTPTLEPDLLDTLFERIEDVHQYDINLIERTGLQRDI